MADNGIIGVIPARYGSTRFPGKPLALIVGKPMIQHVYERAQHAQLLTGVVVATDDDRIRQAVENFGGQVMMTSPAHSTGTDRVAEVADVMGTTVSAVDSLIQRGMKQLRKKLDGYYRENLEN